MNDPDIRWIRRLDNFKRAFVRLADACDLAEERALSDLERQGLIQAFEFTHELAWNTIKDFLAFRNPSEKLYGSKDATRAAYAEELIESGETWMQMIQHRNQSSHTYNVDVAEAIMEAVLDNYLPAFRAFLAKFEELEEDEQ